MTNLELQNELKKYPDDVEVLIFTTDFAADVEIKRVTEGKSTDYKGKILLKNYSTSDIPQLLLRKF